MKANIKINVSLSITCDREILSYIICYACNHFTELSTATDSYGASRHSKGQHKFHAGKIE